MHERIQALPLKWENETVAKFLEAQKEREKSLWRHYNGGFFGFSALLSAVTVAYGVSMIDHSMIDQEFYVFLGGGITYIISILFFSHFFMALEFLDRRKSYAKEKVEAGIAAQLIPPLHDEVINFNRAIYVLERFLTAKEKLNLETNSDMEAILFRKVGELEQRRVDLQLKIALVEKLWGIQENEFDNLSEILFENEQEASSSVKEMLEASLRRLSANLEVERTLAGIEPIDSGRKRLRKNS